MKYLVTGGCGFVGANLSARLIKEGKGQVIVCDNLSGAGAESNRAWLQSLGGSLDFERADVRVPAEVNSLVERHHPDVVFHLAGQIAMTTSMADPRKDFETNTLGSINLLEGVRAYCPNAAIVYASTNKVYGALATVSLREELLRYTAPNHPRGVDESAPLDFQTPYGCSKGAADQYMLDYARIYGLNTVVFRHSTIYGERQLGTFDQGWVGWFCQQGVAVLSDPTRPPFTIAGNGRQVRDLLYVDDAVDAYLSAAARMADVRGEVFNIGGGMENSSSLLELFAQLEEMLGIQMRFECLPWRPSDQRYFVADHGKASLRLGWTPRVTKAVGVARMVEWCRSLAESANR
jgi:CDP-paratose 2-epimerase